jgi:hypothetical protein
MLQLLRQTGVAFSSRGSSPSRCDAICQRSVSAAEEDQFHCSGQEEIHIMLV